MENKVVELWKQVHKIILDSGDVYDYDREGAIQKLMEKFVIAESSPIIKSFQKSTVFVPAVEGQREPLLEVKAFVLTEFNYQEVKREIAQTVWVEFQKESMQRMKSFIESEYPNFPLKP